MNKLQFIQEHELVKSGKFEITELIPDDTIMVEEVGITPCENYAIIYLNENKVIYSWYMVANGASVTTTWEKFLAKYFKPFNA